MTPFSKLKPTPVVAGRTLRFIIASNAPQSAPLPTFVLSPITMSHDARPTANHANHANDEAVLPPFPNVPSLKRTAGTLDDMTNKMMKDDVVEMQGNDRVSDVRHHQPPPEKKMRSFVFPLAAMEMQSRGRPRKNPLPSHVPDAAPVVRTVQQTTQPPSPAIIIAAPAPIAASGGVVSKYSGVYWNSSHKKYMSLLYHNGKRIYFGSSADAKEAAFMRDRAWRDLGKHPTLLNFDDTVQIPNEYLASVAKASKKVAWLAAGVPPPPPPLEQTAQPSSQDAVQGLESLAIAAPSAENEDGDAPLQAAEYENEVPPAAASSPTTTIINYNIHSGASATFHINYNNSSPAAAGIPNIHHHVAQSPSAE